MLSPILFCIYITELEDKLRKRFIGGVTIRNLRIWSLAYADDIVLLAKNRVALLDMMETLKKFLNSRRMILSTDKTKILVFNRGRNGKKEKWWWNKNEIEEVNNFKYLGFNFNSEGNHKDHITELKKKGNIAIRKVWGLGERKFKGDYRKRKMLFDYLVKGVMCYAVEIWGWCEYKELEKIQSDYLRWILKLDFCTPRYIVYRETDCKKLRVEWGRRAVKFEMKIEKWGEERLVKLCWLEKIENGGKDNYSTMRRKYYNRLGWSVENIEFRKQLNKDIKEEAFERDSDIERQEIESKIRESKYNKRYKDIMPKGLPAYLKDGLKIKDMEFLARIRCGNFEEANQYWKKEEDRKCVICNEEVGTWEHLSERCVGLDREFKYRSVVRNREYREIANEKGKKENIEILKEIDKKRIEKKKEGSC